MDHSELIDMGHGDQLSRHPESTLTLIAIFKIGSIVVGGVDLCLSGNTLAVDQKPVIKILVRTDGRKVGTTLNITD